MPATADSRYLVIRPTKAQLARVWPAVFELRYGGGTFADRANVFRRELAAIFSRRVGRRGMPDEATVAVVDVEPFSLSVPFGLPRKTRVEVRLTWDD